MAMIAELINGRFLDHDIKFSNSGPMSGIVHGVQSITAAGTVTLSLNEANTQLKADVLSIDPGGADRSVLLPAALSGTDSNIVTMAGRIIRVFNAADANAEDLTIFESDGTTFVARVGRGACVEILFTAQGEPRCLNEIFESTITMASNTANQPITDAIGANYTIVPVEAYVASTTGNPASTPYAINDGTNTISTTTANDLAANNFMRIGMGMNGTAVITASIIAPNVAINIVTSTALTVTDVSCKLYYRVVKKDLSELT